MDIPVLPIQQYSLHELGIFYHKFRIFIEGVAERIGVSHQKLIRVKIKLSQNKMPKSTKKNQKVCAPRDSIKYFFLRNIFAIPSIPCQRWANLKPMYSLINKLYCGVYLSKYYYLKNSTTKSFYFILKSPRFQVSPY